MALNAIGYLLSNPIVQNFLINLAAAATYDQGRKVVSCIYNHFYTRKDFFPENQIKTIKPHLKKYLKKQTRIPEAIGRRFWRDFSLFMFSGQFKTANDLTENDCEYIAERVFYGVTFQSILIELGYDKESIEYMYRMQGRTPRLVYFFDAKAKDRTLQIDNLTVVRVIDNRVPGMLDSVLAIPSIIQDINQTNPRSRFRDHDLYVIVQSGHTNSSIVDAVRDILHRHQQMNPDLPRILYLEKDHMDHLISLPKEDRVRFLKEQIRMIRIDRGI